MTAWWRTFLSQPGAAQQLAAASAHRRAAHLVEHVRDVVVGEGAIAATQLRSAGEALLVHAWYRARRRPGAPVPFDVAVTALAGLQLVDEAFALTAAGTTQDTS